MIDGASDPLHYWRECRSVEVHLTFFSIARRRTRFVVENEPRELQVVSPKTLEILFQENLK